MPVAINVQSGLAEDLPQESLQQSLQSGSHHIPLVDAQGNHFVAPYEEAQDFLSQGYTQPSSSQLQELLDHAKYSAPLEQAKTFGEGAAEAATFGTSTGVEKLLGAKDKDIQGRRNTNPGMHTLGQVGGLAASTLLPGSGAMGVMGKAGEAVAGLAPAGNALLARAARTAIKQATEVALLQTGDEVSKLIANDPNQSAESFVSEVGLAGLLGGALGGAGKLAAEPLWAATKGMKLGGMLSAIKNKVEGAAESQVSKDAAQAAGIELSPEMRGAMTPEGQRAGQVLQEADSKAGKGYRAAREADEAKLNDAALESLGKAGEAGKAPSQSEAGQAVKDAFEADLDAGVKPVTDEYKAVTEGMDKQVLPVETKLRDVPGPLGTTQEEYVSRPVHDEIAEGINKIGLEDGHFKSPSSAEMGQINRITKELPLQETIGDLRNLRSKVVADLRSANAFQFSKKAGQVFDDAIEGAVERSLGNKAPELLARYSAVKQDYRMVKEMLEYLNDHLHAGKSYGVESFLENFRSLEPEKVLSRLKASKDAGLQQFLSERMPQVAEAIKGHQLDSLIEKAGSYKSLSFAQGLFKELEKMSPEAKSFILPEGAMDRLSGIKTLLDQMPKSGNPSKTAGMMDSLQKHMLGGIGAAVAAATGHNPVLGGLLGTLGRYIGREIPDHGRLAMLKFLGTEAPVNPAAFKTMFEAVGKMHAADNAITKASKAIFRAGIDVGEDKLVPNPKHIEQLDNSLKAAQENPEPLMNVAGDLGHYMPEHAAAIGATASRAVGYLNSLRPNTTPPGPLDPNRQPSKPEQAAYERQLALANKPLLILQHIKHGTIIPQDVTTIRTLYPALYQQMGQKLLEAAIDHKSTGGNIPYKARLGLSAFTGQALDSSMSPTSVLSNQMPSQQPPAPTPSKASAIKKTPALYATSYQTREQSRQSR